MEVHPKSSALTTIIFRFKLKEPLDDIFNNPIETIKKYPDMANYIYEYIDDESFYELVSNNEDVKSILKDNAKLKFIRIEKKYLDENRYEMEQNNDCYLLLVKDKFVEDKASGKYTKDIEIESMVKIDPYDKEEYGGTLSGMRMRSRFQPGLTLNIIWLEKDMYDFDEDDINSDEFSFLRRTIKDKMEEVR